MTNKKLPLPGVNIVLKNSDVGVISDIDGAFEFEEATETKRCSLI